MSIFIIVSLAHLWLLLLFFGSASHLLTVLNDDSCALQIVADEAIVSLRTKER